MILHHLETPSSHRSRCSWVSTTPLLFLALCGLQLIYTPLVWSGGPAPGYEIDLNELKKLKGAPPAKKGSSSAGKPAPQQTASRNVDQPAHNGGSATYTIKPGDNLFKILMRDFGMSNREAELLIPEIIRANALSSGTRLTVGQKIVIQKESSSSAEPHRKKAAPPRRQKQHSPSVEPTIPLQAPTAATPKVSSPHRQEPIRSLATMPLEVRSITVTDPNLLVEGVLAALSIPWTPDKVIEGTTSRENGERFSIKVDHYLEFQNKPYVIAANGQDPFAYTMHRLLEMGGYTVIRLDTKPGFTALASHLLTQLEIPFVPGLHRFNANADKGETRELNGFMVTLPHKPVRLFLTDTPLDAVTAEQLTTTRVEAITVPKP